MFHYLIKSLYLPVRVHDESITFVIPDEELFSL